MYLRDHGVDFKHITLNCCIMVMMNKILTLAPFPTGITLALELNLDGPCKDLFLR